MIERPARSAHRPMAESSTEHPPRPSTETNPAAVFGLVLFMGIAGIVVVLALLVAVFPGGGTGGPSGATVLLLIAAMPVVLSIVAFVAIRWPATMTGGLIVACMLFNESIERLYLPVGFFKVYPQDVLLLAALVTAFLRTRSAEAPPRWMSTRLGKWIVVAILFASVQAIRGVALGNELNAAFGDLRRGYFYMIVFFLVLAESSDPKRLRVLHRAFLVGAIAIVARGLYRLFLGRFFQLSWFDVFHVLGHSDIVFVTFLSYYCLARLIYPAAGGRRSPRAAAGRWGMLLLFPTTLVLIVLGNFRAGWIGFVLAGMVGFVLLPWSKRSALLIAALPVLIVVAAGFYVSRNVRIGGFGETVQEEVASKFKSVLDYETDPNIIWRIHSYRAAWTIWSGDLILGAGLGRRLVFHSINAAGQQSVHFNHRAHNSILWVGYTTGIVGLIIFLCLHATFFFGAARRVKMAGERSEAPVLLAYIAFYVAFMTAALFDVILEESPTAIAMYAHMALVIRLGETVGTKAQERMT